MGNKYRAKKTTVDGITFDSKGEAEYYCYLKQMDQLGAIELLELQPKIYLTNARILYKPDFHIRESGVDIYIDFKGVETAGFRLKKRLWMHYGPAMLRLVRKRSGRFEIYDEINLVQ